MALILDGSLGETFPSWTTAGRPTSPVVGQMGYNTTIGNFDLYTASGWVNPLNGSSSITAAQMPAGSVIQVVQSTKTDTWSTNALASVWNDIPGQGGSGTFQVQITPRSSSSRIMIIGWMMISRTSGQVGRIQLRRDGTPIFYGDTAGNRPLGTGQWWASDNAYGAQPAPALYNMGGTYVDSPATTSQVTYKYMIGADNTSGGGTARVNFTDRDNNSTGVDIRTASSIIAMEIQG